MKGKLKANRAILSELEFHANLMGLMFPKDGKIQGECLKRIMDHNDALRRKVEAHDA